MLKKSHHHHNAPSQISPNGMKNTTFLLLLIDEIQL